MSWTKLQFIEQAFNEIGLASYIYDLSSSELQSALRQLDSMIATWNGRGIRISYPLPSSPSTSDINQLTNVPDSANEAIYTNLAIKIAPSFGKTVSIETKLSAKEGYDLLSSNSVKPREMQLPSTMPAGAGNKNLGRNFDPFLRRPVQNLDKDLEWLYEST